jgi:Tfp pilus assembly PilM family ATPase
MSSDDLKNQVGDLFSSEDAPPALDGLFSGAEALPTRAKVEAARPTGTAVGKEDKPVERTKTRRKGTGLGLRLFGQERLTLSVEADEVRLLVSRGQRVLRWDRIPLPAGTLRNGQVVQLDVFEETVVALLERTGAPRKRAVASLGGQRALVRVITMPSVSGRMLGEAVQRAARRELPLPLDEIYLSWQVLGDRSGSRLQVFLLGIPREAVDSCVVGLRGAGVRLQAMDLKPLALVRAVNLPDVILADLEAQTESVILVREFVPIIVRSVALPGEGERDLAGRAENLVAEIQRTLDFYSSTRASEHAPWSPVVCLTGALGAEEEVRARIRSQWPLVDPAPPLSLPQELPLLSYLANVGLVLKRVT